MKPMASTTEKKSPVALERRQGITSHTDAEPKDTASETAA